MRLATVEVVFDGPPGPDGPRFVEAEVDGRSICLEWIQRPDGFHALRIPNVILDATVPLTLFEVQAVGDGKDTMALLGQAP